MTQERPVDIAVGDKNPLVLSALSGLFDRDPRFNLVVTVSAAESFIEALGRTSVDVGIIGWALPRAGGGSILEALRDRPGAPRIIVYTGSDDRDLPRKVMSLGAAGFFSKDRHPDQLVEAAHAVAGGQMVFPYVDVRELTRDPLEGLTTKERDLLVRLAAGRTNDQLAKDTGVSVNTVKFHLRNIFDKIGVNNRAEAIAYYFSVRR